MTSGFYSNTPASLYQNESLVTVFNIYWEETSDIFGSDKYWLRDW